jgi:MscS family membrane protein
MRNKSDLKISVLSVLFFGAVAVSPVASQVPGLKSPSPPAAAQTTEPDQLGRETPRGCVVGFLRAAGRDDFARAVDYLQLKPSDATTKRARELYSVLNAGGVVDIDALSKDAEGDLSDGLPANRELVGAVDTEDGKVDIVLERMPPRDGRRIWLFTSDTLQNIPHALELVELPHIERYVPRSLREVRIFSVPLYKLIATLLAIVFAMILASIGSRLLFAVARPLFRRVTHEKDDARLSVIRAPLWMILVGLGFRFQSTLSLTVLARQFWIKMSGIMSILGFAWLVVRISNVVVERAAGRLAQREFAGKMAVFTLFHRLFKISVGVAAGVMIVYAAGGSVTTILAGVGLGGIVIALAAQKTLENLFGGVSIISDEPIRVGDFCRFAETLGTVEDIGLRSTRVRTLNRTLVSIPNGQLSVMTLENYTLRDKFLFNQRIGVRYETTPAQMRAILDQTRRLLRVQPNVEQDGWRVNFVEFAASALVFEVFSYILVNDFVVFLETQQEMLLSIFDIVVANGSGLAFPSQTMYLARDKPTDPVLVDEATARLRQVQRDSAQ